MAFVEEDTGYQFQDPVTGEKREHSKFDYVEDDGVGKSTCTFTSQRRRSRGQYRFLKLCIV